MTEKSLKVAHGMVTLDTCEQIGIKVGKRFPTVLNICTHLACSSISLRLSECLLLTILEELLTKGFILPPNMQRKLCCEGIVSEELLCYMSLAFVPNLFTKDHLMELLQYLFIIITPVRETALFLYYISSRSTHLLSL